ncbi:hypothetical protein BGZ76_003838 [Entomortierella beljakovae]|nr:hypothetical protein BGZ76_003838 [Entomortierella beljakovae]
MSVTTTSIQWPPTKETHTITAVINGTTTFIPAYQTANVTLFPNFTTTTTTTKPPPTTVFGAAPPPPYVSGAPTSTSNPDNGSSGNTIRDWALIVSSVVVLAAVGTVLLRRYRSGRAKKQEPGNFTPMGEDDGESEHIGRNGSSVIPGSSISLATLGHHHHQNQATASANNTSVNVRERRNSQPIPRALDLEGNCRS